MKKTFAFCSFILLVVATVTIAGIVLLIISLAGWKEMEQTTVVEEVAEEIELEFPAEETSLENVSLLFADEVADFSSIERINGEIDDQFVYKVTTSSGAARYMAWGSGVLTLPEGLSEISSGSVSTGMERAWAFLDLEKDLILSQEAFLLR